MEIPQLKLLAARVRELLREASCLIGHNQSLDLVAALPGLRNWPEVNAFPERVAACALDLAATGRLAFRLKKKFELERSASELLEALLPATGIARPTPLQVWPGGPPAGVYLTTSQKAIDALLANYEDATDGGVVYAERAGAGHPGSIELGDYGLYANGLDRVPSGTLLVLGPITLDQQSWEEESARLEMACLRAGNEQHRVAVIIDTPTPDTLFEDARLLVQSANDDPHSDLDTLIVGAVSEDGGLHVRPVPQFAATAAPHAPPSLATLDALPPEAVEPIRKALAGRKSGLLFCASANRSEHTGIELAEAMLAMTEHIGPAARIMVRHRSTPAKDWWVPDAVKQLPYLPSIQSAYAQGYRRIVMSSNNYRDGNALMKFPDVLFIGYTWGHDVMNAVRMAIGMDEAQQSAMMSKVIAAVSTLPIPTSSGLVMATDLFVSDSVVTFQSSDSYENVEEKLVNHRVLRREETLTRLLADGVCTEESLKAVLPPHADLQRLLKGRSPVRSAHPTESES